MRIHSREFEVKDALDIGEPVRGWLEVTEDQLAFMGSFTAFTILDEDKPLVCLGQLPLWPGVSDIWAVVSPDLRHCAGRRQVYQHIQDLMLWGVTALDINRYQCEIVAGWDDGVKFAHLLGMKSEGLMEAYGRNGEDMIRYVWLAKDH